jgi:acetyl-CoA carboxylase carboxyl transferase subunit alpha
VILEPLGGAHRDPDAMAEALNNALGNALAELRAVPVDELVARRRRRLASFGVYKET